MKPLPTLFPAILSTGAEGEHFLPLGQILTAPPEEAGEIVTADQQIAHFKACLSPGNRPVLADCGMTVAQQRAALLACGEAAQQPPFIACLALNADGETFDNWQASAAVVLLQSMGCAGIMVTAQDAEAAAQLPQLIGNLYEDARVPLGVMLALKTARSCRWPLTGISFLMPADEEETEALAAVAREHGFFDRPLTMAAPKDPDFFISVSNGHAHLLDATFDIDAELECSADFIDALMQAETDGVASLRLLVDDEDALARFSEEQYMIHLPLCLQTPNGALFEQAVRAFCGRAMYDGTFELEEPLLDQLVKRYGLIVL